MLRKPLIFKGFGFAFLFDRRKRSGSEPGDLPQFFDTFFDSQAIELGGAAKAETFAAVRSDYRTVYHPAAEVAFEGTRLARKVTHHAADE